MLLLLDHPDPVCAVCDDSVVQLQSRITFMSFLIKVIDPCGVETARVAFDSMHQVDLLKQEFLQIAANLVGDAVH